MSKNLIILAGGMSSRMKKSVKVEDLTSEEIKQANERSKGLIGVGNNARPLMDYLLYNAKEAGYKNVYLLIGENGDLFRECYGKNMKDNNFKGLNTSFAVQYIPKDRTKPFGTADALFQTLNQYPELLEQDFTVCNSDNLYSVNALSLLLKTSSANAFINYDRDGLEFTAERLCGFAISVVDDENQLMNIIEKPSTLHLKLLYTCCTYNNKLYDYNKNSFKTNGTLKQKIPNKLKGYQR